MLCTWTSGDSARNYELGKNRAAIIQQKSDSE